MPAIRRRTANRREDVDALSRDQQLHLMCGWTFFDGGFHDLESFGAAWELHRADLTTEFVREFRSRIFIRPFAWWVLDYKQERPVVPPFSRAEAVAHVAACGTAEAFNFLHTHVRDERGRWMQESEESYLRQLGLLTAEEAAWLKSISD